jgi:hypothetical protein
MHRVEQLFVQVNWMVSINPIAAFGTTPSLNIQNHFSIAASAEIATQVPKLP